MTPLGDNDIDRTEIPVPPLVNPVDEPWWRSKRLQGIALFIVSAVLQRYGVVDADTAAIGKTIGGGWSGVGFYNAQNRATRIATATAKAQGVAVPPLKKG